MRYTQEKEKKTESWVSKKKKGEKIRDLRFGERQTRFEEKNINFYELLGNGKKNRKFIGET